jgi:UDP-galactopyranose mutase
MNNFINTPIANYNGEVYSLPFNMWTFNQLWGVTDPNQAKKIIESQRYTGKITNLEEQALSMVGVDVYEKLIKGYTEKQWNKKCSELPSSIIKRLPVRFTWDNNYFNDRYQGIPIGGYTQIFEKLLEGIEVRLNVDYFDDRDFFDEISDKIIYTGPIDKFYNYRFGNLEYRSLKWETKFLEKDNFQGNAVINYTDSETKFTRIIEHKHFDHQNQKNTIISYEFPQDYNSTNEPFYPVRDEINTKKYKQYQDISEQETKVYFGGRLGAYIYYDMHQVIAQTWKFIEKLKNN